MLQSIINKMDNTSICGSFRDENCIDIRSDDDSNRNAIKIIKSVSILWFETFAGIPYKCPHGITEEAIVAASVAIMTHNSGPVTLIQDEIVKEYELKRSTQRELYGDSW